MLTGLAYLAITFLTNIVTGPDVVFLTTIFGFRVRVITIVSALAYWFFSPSCGFIILFLT